MKFTDNRKSVEEIQRKHFDHMAHEYEMNYSDEYSEKYRNIFINKPMLDPINFKGKIVLEAMCGSGQTTEYLLSRGATIIGLDISNELIESFKKKWSKATAVTRSIFDTKFEENSIDVVVIVGGLHHIHPCVEEAINEIYRILKSGGYFCFAEPHEGSFPNLFRGIWYKIDSTFESTEKPINPEFLMKKFSSKFYCKKPQYIGSVAFLLVLNSMIFRIPVRLKKYYANFIINIERFFSFFQNKKTTCLSLNVWQKK